jgi:hypothetical protein
MLDAQHRKEVSNFKFWRKPALLLGSALVQQKVKLLVDLLGYR